MTSIATAPRVGILIGVLVLTAGRGFSCTLDPGDILVTDLGKQAVIEIDTRSGQPCVVSAGGFLTLPTGIAVDAAGQILVVDSEAFAATEGSYGSTLRAARSTPSPRTGTSSILRAWRSPGMEPSSWPTRTRSTAMAASSR